jgi:monoamine oxidase
VKRLDCDVAIIGAGAAGLTAAGLLIRAGKSVRCLEAADRVGGRILTVHDPLSQLPIELGALNSSTDGPRRPGTSFEVQA